MGLVGHNSTGQDGGPAANCLPSCYHRELWCRAHDSSEIPTAPGNDDAAADGLLFLPPPSAATQQHTHTRTRTSVTDSDVNMNVCGAALLRLASALADAGPAAAT